MRKYIVILLFTMNSAAVCQRFDMNAFDFYSNNLFLNIPSVYYNHAIVLCGDKEFNKALIELIQASKLGFSDNKILDEAAFRDLHSRREWNEILSQVEINKAKISDFNNFNIVTSDISNFLTLLAHKNDSGFREMLMTDYIINGSVGLRSFFSTRIYDPNNLVNAVQKSPALYDALRTEAPSFDIIKQKALSSMRLFKELYPQAIYPNVYFVVGINNSGGTSTPEGLLIGAEKQLVKDSMNKYRIKNIDDICTVVIHELVHFQQRYPENPSLLTLALREGSADFIAELLTGRTTYENLKEFGNKNWDILKTEFKKDITSGNNSRWFYNGKGTKEWPGDLGYFVGYRIAKLYYLQSDNKQVSLKNLLILNDPDSIINSIDF
ncbi:MAG: hypothetical protein JWN76_498 [Chitinophagaceae bacterium]|nr:hypothetical protein [Chitinophagaceae bacterium]